MSDEKRTTVEKREYDNGDTKKVVHEETKESVSPRNLPTENASTAGEGPDADTHRTTVIRKEETTEEHDED